ncbi:hypothetical protein FRC09_010926 [Ceratobasidium sp. 395]|nr:hypothetical protein FRC09_010926 [Ceratobasidium sp. 395]
MVLGPAFRDKMYSVLGNGLFNSDGALWKSHRNMTRPYFSKDRISHFDIFARNSDKAISKILARFEETAQNGQPLAMDFQSLAQYFTLDSSAEFLFGDSVHSLDSPLAHPHSPQPNHASAAFANAFQHVMEKLMERFSLDMLWPWFELWRDRTGDDMRVISSYIKPIMDKKLDEYRYSNNKVLDEENHTFLDDLLQRTTDEKLIKDQILNILIAGRDSVRFEVQLEILEGSNTEVEQTGGTLTFAVYFLAMDPAVLAKLREEIISHVGPNAYPTAEHFKEMKYLRSVIDETLRLFPPLPINERTSVRSTVLKSSGGKSFYIAAGTNVNFSVMHMHRRKDLWGPDAEDFDPERWFGERLDKYVGSNPSIFLPFNTGPRNCLGQQFAYNIMSFFLVRLLQRIEAIKLVPEAQPIGTLPPPSWKGAAGRKGFEQIWPKCHLMSSCNGGLWVRMTPAKLTEE